MQILEYKHHYQIVEIEAVYLNSIKYPKNRFI